MGDGWPVAPTYPDAGRTVEIRSSNGDVAYLDR